MKLKLPDRDRQLDNQQSELLEKGLADRQGWRTEVGTRKSLLFRHLSCVLSPIPPLREGGHNSGDQFLLHFYLWPEGRNPRVGTPQGASGKTGPLRGL